ncbi:zinc metalloprotease ywhC [Candidatus Saccharibacteria bacterium 32-50-10]|nr:MAG: zinc metalloprotease ywhC [Candidatus Saccharibacteria bacterium 32-50-10]
MDLQGILTVFGVILVSMTLHEAMHAFMGYFLGDDTAKTEGRLTLNPLKHIDPFLTILLPLVLAIMGGPIFGGAKPVPFNPHRLRYGEWGAALVALAGPLTNLLIAFFAFGVGVVTGVISASGIENTPLGVVVLTTISVNLGFFVFNMLPIPPLDGSRALYALAPEVVRRVMERIEQYGLFVVFAIVLLGGSLIGAIMSTSIQSIISLFEFIFRLGV